MTIGLMGAMPEEMQNVLAAIENPRLHESGCRQYCAGRLMGHDVVGVFSRWGKVAAAVTATELITRHGVGHILFTGIAGGLTSQVHVGDVVVAGKLCQHDMDARPLMPRFEIPLTGTVAFTAHDAMAAVAMQAARSFLDTDTGFRRELAAGGIGSPCVHKGDMVSGDLFISSSAMRAAINRHFPDALCADMESAAVAQVCADYGIPLTVVRVISDSADEQAHAGAVQFVLQHGADYSLGIVRHFLSNLSNPQS